MGFSKRFAEAREKLAKEGQSKADPREDLMRRINQGIVIPIVSNSLRIEQVFSGGGEDSGEENDLSIYEQLTAEWANLIGYPLEDKHNLARVAQYHLVEHKDDPHARTNYLNFLKELLATMAQDDKEYADVAQGLKGQIQDRRFSEIVRALDYPRFSARMEDPLNLLARLPLPIYVTTSQSNFLEQALWAEGKNPRTQICFWTGPIVSANAEHRTDPDFSPSVTNPMVFHLFGIEDYPQTLVLSEDDYINFLISMVEDTNTLNPVVPLVLRRALSESRLLLLGYRLQDWDFRVLFRFLLKFRKEDFSPRGMAIQLKPNQKSNENLEKSIDYLKQYFDRKKFDIEWNTAESFIQELWDDWDAYRRGRG
jgi:SIR2-like protein